jgi:hypothetical protein
MKKIIAIFLCIALCSCATFKNIPNEKKSELVSYYKSFSGGLKLAVDVAVMVKPDLEPAANKAKLAICALDKAVDDYEIELNESRALEAHEAAKTANDAVANILSGYDESAVQSFFGGSIPEA